MPTFSGLPIGMPFNSDERHTTAQLPLGTRAYDGSGNEYTYVKAGAAIAAKEAVKFQGSAAGYDDVRKTAAATDLVLGVATAAFASGDYGFIQTKGVVTALATNSTAVGLVVATATAGTLGAADATSVNSRGITLLVSSGSSGTNGTPVYLG